jgi:hypothetical protein
MHVQRVKNVQDDQPKLAQKFAHPEGAVYTGRRELCGRSAELHEGSLNSLPLRGARLDAIFSDTSN